MVDPLLREDPEETTLEQTEDVRGELHLLIDCESGPVTAALLPGKFSFVLGRARECDIVVDDSTVSRRHAVLRVDEMTLEDLGSQNGTTIGEAALNNGERAPISLGTSFGLGGATLVLRRALPTAKRRNRSEFDRAPIAVDPKTKQVYGLLDVIAPTQLAVLILGETGVGKEVYAEALHRKSNRAAKTLLKLNCAAFTESLLEAELFGFDRGGIPGATHGKMGLFEAADQGTVFLDEVADLTLAVQAKLLRVLESGEVMRLGAGQPRHVDVRFISATNGDLRKAVAEGRFRSDLYFRLAGTTVELPALRDRKLDIEPLARAFLERAGKMLGKPLLTLGASAVARLMDYDWPGNVRELRNSIDRAAAWCDGSVVEANHVVIDIGVIVESPTAAVRPPFSSLSTMAPPLGPPLSAPNGLREEVRSLEKAQITRALAETAGNQSQAAKLLGISRHTLMNRLEEYGLARPRKKKPT